MVEIALADLGALEARINRDTAIVWRCEADTDIFNRIMDV